MQTHAWFIDVDWDKLYDMEAAFKPEVNGELDTRNFMKFDEVKTDLFAFIPLLRVSCLLLSSVDSYHLYHFWFELFLSPNSGYLDFIFEI